ncbi:MAG: hypothetical protein V3W04_06570 [Gammaproteobacteria bacterium]
MSKQILPAELAEIVVGLLVQPDLLGELDSAEKHQAFMLDIGQAVADHCGGIINQVSLPDSDQGGYLSSEYTSPYLSVSPDASLPSLNKNVWRYYDQEGWEEAALEITPCDAVNSVRMMLQNLLCRPDTEEADDQHRYFYCTFVEINGEYEYTCHFLMHCFKDDDPDELLESLILKFREGGVIMRDFAYVDYPGGTAAKIREMLPISLLDFQTMKKYLSVL